MRDGLEMQDAVLITAYTAIIVISVFLFNMTSTGENIQEIRKLEKENDVQQLEDLKDRLDQLEAAPALIGDARDFV
jgi:hypothetical protein